MITYRDMTFCTGNGCRASSRCLRALTPEIEHAASQAGRMLSVMIPSPEMACYVPDQVDAPDQAPEDVAVS